MTQHEPPIATAIILLKLHGCFGAKQMARRIVDAGNTVRGEAHWRSTLEILEGLDVRQTRARLLRHLKHRQRKQAAHNPTERR